MPYAPKWGQQEREREREKETIHQIHHEELRKRRICTKFASHRLADEQKQIEVSSF
jgi:hypothetical protein